MTNWPALAPELTDQPFVVDPSQFIRQPEHYDLGYRQGHLPGIAVAAVDTPDDLRRLADTKYRCDGVDDHVQLNNALLTGSPVFALPGSFTLGDELASAVDGQTIEGFGLATTLKMSSVLTRLIYVSHDNVSIRNMKLDGSFSPGASMGIRAQACDTTLIEGVMASDFFEAVFLGGGVLSDPTVIRCQFVNNAYGVWAAADRGKIVRCRISGSSVAGVFSNQSGEIHQNVILAGADGLYVRGETKVYANTVRGPAGVGIKADLGEQSQLVGNYVTACGTHGIETTSDSVECLIAHNFVNSSSQNTNDTYDNYRIAGDEHTVVGNVSRRNTLLTNQPKYGMNVAAGATDNFVTTNDLLGSGLTAAFIDSGTGTITTAGNRT